MPKSAAERQKARRTRLARGEILVQLKLTRAEADRLAALGLLADWDDGNPEAITAAVSLHLRASLGVTRDDAG